MVSPQEKGILLFSHLILILASAACVIPFVIMIAASVTSENSLVLSGYQLLPREFSFAAYEYLWLQKEAILRAYGITVITTALGTGISLVITVLLAYPLAIRDLPGRGLVSFLLIFSMLFNGGLVPTYIMYTQYFHLKNTLWALIVPGMLMNAFNVILIRSYFISSVPGEMIEAGRIDGAGEYGILFKIVLPISTPILATIGLMTGLGYWNNWYNGMIYLSDDTWYSIQVLLNAILTNVQYLANNEVGARLNIRLPTASVRMAIAAIAVLPILIAYPFFQKYFVKSITLGAIKG
ncbi:MAG: carbohydrate ABC transporter permease [Treponema sp.]|jgi:putative aldouronate transport system permease protein|nr:carbohydrate ABC transporter permease [Treponema sp.]